MARQAPKIKRVTTPVALDTYEYIKRIAHDEHSTVRNVVRAAIERGLANFDVRDLQPDGRRVTV
jgi:hypothetical protein